MNWYDRLASLLHQYSVRNIEAALSRMWLAVACEMIGVIRIRLNLSVTWSGALADASGHRPIRLKLEIGATHIVGQNSMGEIVDGDK